MTSGDVKSTCRVWMEKDSPDSRPEKVSSNERSGEASSRDRTGTLDSPQLVSGEMTLTSGGFRSTCRVWMEMDLPDSRPEKVRRDRRSEEISSRVQPQFSSTTPPATSHGLTTSITDGQTTSITDGLDDLDLVTSTPSDSDRPRMWKNSEEPILEDANLEPKRMTYSNFVYSRDKWIETPKSSRQEGMSRDVWDVKSEHCLSEMVSGRESARSTCPSIPWNERLETLLLKEPEVFEDGRLTRADEVFSIPSHWINLEQRKSMSKRTKTKFHMLDSVNSIKKVLVDLKEDHALLLGLWLIFSWIISIFLFVSGVNLWKPFSWWIFLTLVLMCFFRLTSGSSTPRSAKILMTSLRTEMMDKMDYNFTKFKFRRALYKEIKEGSMIYDEYVV